VQTSNAKMSGSTAMRRGASVSQKRSRISLINGMFTADAGEKVSRERLLFYLVSRLEHSFNRLILSPSVGPVQGTDLRPV